MTIAMMIYMIPIFLFSSGFAETGAEGAAMQDEITRIARETGTRVIGPNCLGAFNSETRFYPTFTSTIDRATPVPGGISIASQSGAVGSDQGRPCTAKRVHDLGRIGGARVHRVHRVVRHWLFQRHAMGKGSAFSLHSAYAVKERLFLSEHLRVEAPVFGRFFDGKRYAPRHVGVRFPASHECPIRSAAAKGW